MKEMDRANVDTDDFRTQMTTFLPGGEAVRHITYPKDLIVKKGSSMSASAVW